MSYGKCNTPLGKFVQCCHYTGNFRCSRDESNSRLVVVGNCPVSSVNKVFSAVHIFKRFEPVYSWKKVCRCVSSSFREIDEWAFCMPPQECCRCRSRKRFQKTQKLRVYRFFLSLTQRYVNEFISLSHGEEWGPYNDGRQKSTVY